MQGTRMTKAMRGLLEERVRMLDSRIRDLAVQGPDVDDSGDAGALLAHLSRERDQILEALREAVLIDDAEFDRSAIETGDRVTIRDPAGEVLRYVLVEGSSPRVRSDWVSVSSPLGAALLGKGVGEKVVVSTPAGRSSYVILAFERASDRATA